MFHAASGMFSLGVLKLVLGRMKPFSNIMAALMTAMTPLAFSKWPTLLFTDPSWRGFLGVLPSEKTLWMAVASIGSPTLVPVPENGQPIWLALGRDVCISYVPCASTKPTSLGLMPARLYTSRIRVSWAFPLGEVIPVDIVTMSATLRSWATRSADTHRRCGHLDPHQS